MQGEQQAFNVVDMRSGGATIAKCCKVGSVYNILPYLRNRISVSKLCCQDLIQVTVTP
jgi:hypothetical protein